MNIKQLQEVNIALTNVKNEIIQLYNDVLEKETAIKDIKNKMYIYYYICINIIVNKYYIVKMKLLIHQHIQRYSQ